ncbi:hypothetical protein K7X08_016009 [Anisodus acutangulus]|uniref:Uncharacterized protein n=1 Tax=Anisodus acutangulus TaxID=402998 RepID=A0A9Q1QYS7_9SOLA|nr:hypothetical protein K7X08_016009 [Anisodus acutangulus]
MDWIRRKWALRPQARLLVSGRWQEKLWAKEGDSRIGIQVPTIPSHIRDIEPDTLFIEDDEEGATSAVERKCDYPMGDTQPDKPDLLFGVLENVYTADESMLMEQVLGFQDSLTKNDGEMANFEIALVMSQDKAKDHDENMSVLQSALQTTGNDKKTLEEKNVQAKQYLVGMKAEIILERNVHAWHNRR